MMNVSVGIACLLLIAPISLALARPDRRRVDCNFTGKVVPDFADALYSVGFNDTTVNFDALAIFAFTAFQGNDFGEYLNTVNGIKDKINSLQNVSDIADVWNSAWQPLADALVHEGDTYFAEGDNISAASAWHRASNAYQLAGRFNADLVSNASVAVYVQSVDSFVKAVTLDTNGVYARCQVVKMPFEGSFLHGYWCPSSASGVSKTIVTLNGYDGTAEWQYYAIASAMVPRGYNVLVMEGPGQGYTARVFGLHFFPDYERAASAILDYARATYGVAEAILWGESFGGYLAPRGFAMDSRWSALVTNGGVLDFYQTMMCKYPPDFQNLFYANSPETDAMMNGIFDKIKKTNSGAAFMAAYSRLGLGPNATTLTSILDMLEPYTLSAVMGNFSNRHVFVYDPAWDQLTGNQSQLFWNAIPDPSPQSVIVQLDPRRGAGVHCGVGGTANLNIAIARWLRDTL